MTPTEPTYSCWLNCILRCLICTNVVNSTRLRASPENNHHSEHTYKCYITQSSLNRPCLLQHDRMLIFVLKDIFQQLRHQHRVYHRWKFRCFRPFPSAPLLMPSAFPSFSRPDTLISVSMPSSLPSSSSFNFLSEIIWVMNRLDSAGTTKTN
jgi:hypothetical protein